MQRQNQFILTFKIYIRDFIFSEIIVSDVCEVSVTSGPFVVDIRPFENILIIFAMPTTYLCLKCLDGESLRILNASCSY